MNVNKYTLLLVFSGLSLTLFSQESLELFSQSSIDAINIDFSHVQELDTLIIDDACEDGDVTDLSVFLGLKRVNYLKLMSVCKLETLLGLDSLTEVKTLHLSGPAVLNDTISLLKLKRVDTLQVFSAGEFEDLKIFRSLINCNSMHLQYSQSLIGLQHFKPKDNFRLSIFYGSSSCDITDILKFCDSTLSFLNISLSEGSRCINPPDIEIGTLALSRSNDVDFQDLLELCVDTLTIRKTTFQTIPIVSNLEEVSVLSIIETNQFVDLALQFPKLTSITGLLNLVNNENLSNIGFSETPFIPELDINTSSHFNITGNQNLKECKEEYLCLALELYPGKVSIEGNGTSCDKETLLDECMTSIEEIATQKKYSHGITIFNHELPEFLNSYYPDCSELVVTNISGIQNVFLSRKLARTILSPGSYIMRCLYSNDARYVVVVE